MNVTMGGSPVWMFSVILRARTSAVFSGSPYKEIEKERKDGAGGRGGPEEMAMAHEGILIPISWPHQGQVPENERS